MAHAGPFPSLDGGADESFSDVITNRVDIAKANDPTINDDARMIVNYPGHCKVVHYTDEPVQMTDWAGTPIPLNDAYVSHARQLIGDLSVVWFNVNGNIETDAVLPSDDNGDGSLDIRTRVNDIKQYYNIPPGNEVLVEFTDGNCFVFEDPPILFDANVAHNVPYQPDSWYAQKAHEALFDETVVWTITSQNDIFAPVFDDPPVPFDDGGE